MADKEVLWEKEMRLMFEDFDDDGDGEISVRELELFALSIGEPLTIKELEYMIDQIDTNENGRIDFEEFKKVTKEFFKSMYN